MNILLCASAEDCTKSMSGVCTSYFQAMRSINYKANTSSVRKSVILNTTVQWPGVDKGFLGE